MTINNLQHRVVFIALPLRRADDKPDQPASNVETVALKPGLNQLDDAKRDAIASNPEVVAMVSAGELVIHDAKQDPFSGPPKAVVAAVEQTLDRDLLLELRAREKRAPVLAAIEAQLKKLTDHRTAA
jgi:hypothetical protein